MSDGSWLLKIRFPSLGAILYSSLCRGVKKASVALKGDRLWEWDEKVSGLDNRRVNVLVQNSAQNAVRVVKRRILASCYVQIRKLEEENSVTTWGGSGCLANMFCTRKWTGGYSWGLELTQGELEWFAGRLEKGLDKVEDHLKFKSCDWEVI